MIMNVDSKSQSRNKLQSPMHLETYWEGWMGQGVWGKGPMSDDCLLFTGIKCLNWSVTGNQ